jgi:hypothetical protein
MQPLILALALLSAAGLASVSRPPEPPGRAVRALGPRHPALLTGRLERSLPPETYVDLAAPPSPEELARAPGYFLPPGPEPEASGSQAQNDYVDLWHRELPFPPRWRPR